MIKILTIGGATQDIFLNYQGADSITINKKNVTQNYMLFESGEKVEIDGLTYCSGGGATNAATSFKRLGFSTGCFCAMSNDAVGDFIIQELENERIDLSLINRNSTYQTGISCIINTINGERTVLAFRGANSHLDLTQLSFDTIRQYNQLYITSLSDKSALSLPSIVALAKQHNIPVAINPGTSQLAKGTLSLRESLRYIDILILNSNEARTFMTALVAVDETYKKKLQGPSSQTACTLNLPNNQPYLMELALNCQNYYFTLQKFFKTVLGMGPSIVVVTNGANGVYAASGTTAYFHPSLKINVVNTVGAGDSFGSCFVASLLLGKTIQEALRCGIVNSASVLEHLGAKKGLLTRQQVQEKISMLSPDLLQTFNL